MFIEFIVSLIAETMRALLIEALSERVRRANEQRKRRALRRRHINAYMHERRTEPRAQVTHRTNADSPP